MFCGNCGKEIKEGKKLCTNCGAPVDCLEQKNINFSAMIKNKKCITEYKFDVNPDCMDTIKFGNYPQNDKDGETKESIEWLLLKKEKDKVLLLSKYVLDCQKYDTNGHVKCWADSSIRKWLNENFYYNAFSNAEKQIIIESIIINKTAKGYNDFADELESKDKVFIPSISELQSLFENNLDYHFLRLCAKPTKYAIARNILQFQDYIDWNKWADGTSWYWLRNVVESGNAAVINGNGSLGYTCGLSQYDNSCGVRPAIWVKI